MKIRIGDYVAWITRESSYAKPGEKRWVLMEVTGFTDAAMSGTVLYDSTFVDKVGSNSMYGIGLKHWVELFWLQKGDTGIFTYTRDRIQISKIYPINDQLLVDYKFLDSPDNSSMDRIGLVNTNFIPDADE